MKLFSTDWCYLGSASLLSKKTENSGTGSDVEHNLVPEVSQVGQNGLLVGRRPNEVLHHVLLLREVTVKLEVLGGRRILRASLEDRDRCPRSEKNISLKLGLPRILFKKKPSQAPQQGIHLCRFYTISSDAPILGG